MRATNWIGDAVMSLPTLRAIREIFPKARISILAKPWVADVYARESAIDGVIPYAGTRREIAARLRAQRFDAAILLQNAFDAALVTWMAGIPVRIGYNRDRRGLLLTHAIPVPEPGEIPRHERFYYLELLRRARLMERFPVCNAIRLDGLDAARADGAAFLARLGIAGPVIGVSPGAAFGSAKRWPADRFAQVAREFPRALLFGSKAERELCDGIAANVPGAVNLAGQTTLREFIDLASVCRLFLTNDSGAMHLASAAGVPTVTVFGATDDTTTGPTGPLARVVREHAECSPCLLRECPIDHRCMTRVTPERVAAVARELFETYQPPRDGGVLAC